MLRSTFYQISLLSVDPDEIKLEKDSFERALPDLLPRLVSLDDFREFHPSTMGAGTCCPLVLTAMLLLQFRYNLTDEALIARCIRDLGFRYALGLPRWKGPPRISSFRRFRAWVRVAKGPEWLFRLSLTLPKEAGLIEDADLQVVDSTNTDCRGAICDTYNLIAAAIGAVVREVARHRGRTAESVAKQWGLSQYMGRSIKSAVDIDWSDESDRNALVTMEVRDADRLPRMISGVIKRDADVSAALEFLAKVAHQDVEQLPDGTYKIAKGTASGRIVSQTDQEARHGRKSASQPITGFKTHVLGTVESLFVTGIMMTDAGVHDSIPTPDLLAQAAESGLKPTRALGDGAYGTGPNLRACAQMGVELLTKQGAANRGGLTKRDFEIAPDAQSVTCPAGHTSTKHTLIKNRDGAKNADGSDVRVPSFKFSKAVCKGCPLAAQCGKNVETEGREIVFNANEAELQAIKHFNATPESKPLLRRRCAIERLLSHLVRMGMRQARFFGLHMAQFQAFMTAAAYNLQRFITMSTARP